MAYNRMGRQENGVTATMLARGSRECGMEVWRGGAQVAIGCGQKGSIARSYCDLVGGLRFAGHSPGLEDRVLSNMRIGAPILIFSRASARCESTCEEAGWPRRDLVQLRRASPYGESDIVRSVTLQRISAWFLAAWPYVGRL